MIMEKIELKYRTWYKGSAPKPIKLEIPGWSGEHNSHKNGDIPQPWHCPPFVDGSTYGLELCYPFDTEARITLENGKLKIEGDFSKESEESGVDLPPFKSFTPTHFGMTSSIDIKVPTGYVLRTEPHPRFFTDITNTVPCCLTGHLQTDWWPKVFFVVFKNPIEGQTLIFRKDEPYVQILIVPKKISYDIKEMTSSEINERLLNDDKIGKYARNFVRNDWRDNAGQKFDDKYKVLSGVAAKYGSNSIRSFVESVAEKVEKNKKFSRRLLIKRKNESVQDQEKEV